MSYREIRNFTEIMRALGYPRLISMENFRKPNFELVADILYWMVKLYDPETTISDRVEFENERVEFLTGIANLMATKARLKLNTKKLYASDGRAVQELLKLATLLYRAIKSTHTQLNTDEPPPQIKVSDVKAARLLASEITHSGTKVYDLLADEAVGRQDRARAIRFLDQAASSTDGSREQAYVERSIRELIDTSKQSVEDMKKECEELEADERNIDSKIKKKQEELDRTEKRLRSLDNVRPQFMHEVEKLEIDLQKHYDIYMEKYRNLDYLEHESEKYLRNEEERREEQERRLKKMRERLLKEEVDLLRGGRGGDGDEEIGGKGGTSRTAAGGNTSQRTNGSNRGAGGKGRATVQGNMRGESEEESSEGKDNVMMFT
jgi:clusterin-associated protein 1